jgi:hypothetical protein
MNPIQKDELYENISQFLKTKGIELKEGSYTKSVHAGCSLLADAINLSQAGIERAKTGLERKLDQVRQVIHEKTAPKPPVATAPSPAAPNGKAKRTVRSRRTATAKRTKRKA